MDRGAWWATVHGVTKSDMTEQLSTQTHRGLVDTVVLFSVVLRMRKHRGCVQLTETWLMISQWIEPRII